MRLINVHNYEIHEFIGEDTPPYAILSHCWDIDEVSLSDMQSGRAWGRLGFQKIQRTCEKAEEDGLSWAWADTCCIDKTNSAELNEAINSMYAWYGAAVVCYAYLADYSTVFKDGHDLRSSRWFTRGWTLQELIAPPKVEFYDMGWAFIGSRDKMAGLVNEITGIPQKVLFGDQSPLEHTVAMRMSWASKRSCSRIEDTAYCLMGLFDVHMPLIYGERKKAFIRLQEAILQDSHDQTLLAWTVDENSSQAWTRMGVLAESPANFDLKLSKELRSFPDDSWEPWSMTPLGLRVLGLLRDFHFPNRGRRLLDMPQLFSGFQIFETLLGCGCSRSRSFVTMRIIRKPDSTRTYHRLVMPYLEYHYGQSVGFNPEPPEPFYLAKRSTGVPKALFESGGIHLLHLPITRHDSLKRLCRGREVVSTAPYNAVSLTDSTGRPRPLSQSASIQFEDKPLDAFEPFHMVFGHTLYPGGNLFSAGFSLYFGLGKQHAYIGLFDGSKRIPGRDVERDLRAKPHAYCSDVDLIRDKRGELARDNLQVGEILVQTRLVSEDARTLDSEMVGTRVHFFLLMEFEDKQPYTDSTDIQDENDADGGGSTLSSSGVIVSRDEAPNGQEAGPLGQILKAPL